MRFDTREWPNRERWIDVAWVLFSIANLVAMVRYADWETVPFHFIWVSLTLLYGFRVWKVRPTLTVLAAVMLSTATLIWFDVTRNTQPIDEITEVPLMAAMFLAMVWHARRRLTATEETERVSTANRRLLERQRQFLQDASHELRTPITVALGHAELIQRNGADPTIAQDAAVIADELIRLRRLADRLLLLAGSEDPEFLYRTRIEVDTIVVDAVHRWATTPRRWLLGNAEEATVLADTDRLAAAIDALIENAVHHTQEDDTIEVGVRRRGSGAVISVRDTGTGIPVADLDHIFDRFARADRGRSRRTGGSGLGLPIVKAITDAHGGQLDVTSTEGVGSTFEISLPIIPNSVQGEHGPDGPDGLRPSHHATPGPATMASEEDARDLAT
jgi:signal transduction histidine kinase